MTTLTNSIQTIHGIPGGLIKPQFAETIAMAKISNTVIIFKSGIGDILINPNSTIEDVMARYYGLNEERGKNRSVSINDSNETMDPLLFLNHFSSIDNTDFSNIIVLIEWFEKYFELQDQSRDIDKTTIVEKIIKTVEKFGYKYNYIPTKEIKDLTWNDPEVIQFAIGNLLKSLEEEDGIIRNPLFHQLRRLREYLISS